MSSLEILPIICNSTRLFQASFKKCKLTYGKVRWDADTLIGKTAKSCAEDRFVENTDVLMILLHHWNGDSRDIFSCKRQETSKKTKPIHATKNQAVQVGVRRKKPMLM